MAKLIQIDVISDTVCPWCYIGKKRLETAIRLYKEKHDSVGFIVRWHPYQLEPNLPKEVNKLKFYQDKFGASLQSKLLNVSEAFAKEGLTYSADGLIGNTFNSHRLISFAGRADEESHTGKQNAVVEQLFKAYFTQGKSLNDRSVLLEAARAAGVPNAESVVDDETVEADKVKTEVHKFKNKVGGVPLFIINGAYSLSGARDSDTFESIFDDTLA